MDIYILTEVDRTETTILTERDHFETITNIRSNQASAYR